MRQLRNASVSAAATVLAPPQPCQRRHATPPATHDHNCPPMRPRRPHSRRQRRHRCLSRASAFTDPPATPGFSTLSSLTECSAYELTRTPLQPLAPFLRERSVESVSGRQHSRQMSITSVPGLLEDLYTSRNSQEV